MDTDVLIIGAGPVGLTLAVDLGRRGVRTMLIEQKPAPAKLPKMERCNARTMEIYRRMGLMERVRAAGLPADVPMDIFIVTSLVDPPIFHFPYPSVAEAKQEITAANGGTLPLEPYQLISQYTLEPLLKSVAEHLPSVSVRFGHEFLSFAQGPDSVSADIRADGKAVTVQAKYLVGCDGGTSTVRKQLGIGLTGETLLQLRQALYHCPELYARIPIGKGRHYHVADRQSTQLIIQDDTRHFSLHSIVDKDEDMLAKFEETVGMPVQYEMLSVGAWRQNLLIAERYGGGGRVFLAGDAVHLVIPTGGLGMNSGVGDAIDLGWKLAATLAGWGGPGLLAAYEAERRPVGVNNVAASRHATVGRRVWRGQIPANIRDKTPEGDAARARLAVIVDVEQRKSSEMIGAELGYHYHGSPLIASEADAPPYDFIRYTPSTCPGVRLPHVWLAGGVAMQDRLGEGYTLLRLGGGTPADAAALARAFAKFNAPFAALDVPDAAARDLYGRDLLLVRPDLHVVWRGNAPPDDPGKLAALATGN